MIREAKPSDVEHIVCLADMLANQLYPKLRADEAKISELVASTIPGRQHFSQVSFSTVLDAVLLAVVTDNTWAQRKNAHIMLWWSRKPGEGANLLRNFRDWVQSRRAIRVAGMHPDIDLDPRAIALVQRVGFEQHGGAYLMYN